MYLNVEIKKSRDNEKILTVSECEKQVLTLACRIVKEMARQVKNEPDKVYIYGNNALIFASALKRLNFINEHSKLRPPEYDMGYYNNRPWNDDAEDDDDGLD